MALRPGEVIGDWGLTMLMTAWSGETTKIWIHRWSSGSGRMTKISWRWPLAVSSTETSVRAGKLFLNYSLMFTLISTSWLWLPGWDRWDIREQYCPGNTENRQKIEEKFSNVSSARKLYFCSKRPFFTPQSWILWNNIPAWRAEDTGHLATGMTSNQCTVYSRRCE